MPSIDRKYLLLAVFMFSALLQPIAFAQRCSGTPGCARTSSAAADPSGVAGLNGQFAFQLNGTLTTPGVASRATAAVGSFTADGQGNITAGEMDFVSAAQTFQALAITGTYTLDSVSGIGTLNLASTQGTESFAVYTTGGGLPPYASGSLVETDGGPVVSSGSFYQQSPDYFRAPGVSGYWRMSLTGETFVREGAPSPIFVSGNVYLQFPFNNIYSTFTMRVGSGVPEGMSWALRTGYSLYFDDGRIAFGATDYPNMVAYIIDGLHILVMSAEPPQGFPLVSGTMTRDSFPSQ
jgi:hypothetical protein